MVGAVKLKAALTAASVVTALPAASLSKPAVISKVSTVPVAVPAKPGVACRDRPLAWVRTIVRSVVEFPDP